MNNAPINTDWQDFKNWAKRLAISVFWRTALLLTTLPLSYIADPEYKDQTTIVGTLRYMFFLFLVMVVLIAIWPIFMFMVRIYVFVVGSDLFMAYMINKELHRLEDRK